MILFNTTFAVDTRFADAFIDFIRGTYIPEAEKWNAYGILLTEMQSIDTDGGLEEQQVRTFALQLRIPSEEIFENFHNNAVISMYGLISKTWGAGVCMFESRLDVIYDHTKADGRKS